MKKTKTQKPITLTEFQAWLQGVEELHPKNWTPSPEQWKLIRNKIKLIQETSSPQLEFTPPTSYKYSDSALQATSSNLYVPTSPASSIMTQIPLQPSLPDNNDSNDEYKSPFK